MEVKTIVTETFLSRRGHRRALDFTLFLEALLFLGAFLFLNGSGQSWMAASPAAVFERHEYWRLWTTLFAHADLGHILSNALLFFPFSFFLAGYFGPLFFPGLGLFLGGVTNALVLTTMPPDAELIGVSGVVYWMGAAWLTLYLLIERHEPRARRWGKVIFITVVLFIPESFRPEVSYLSHLGGFLFGILSGFAYYYVNRRAIRAAEKREVILVENIVSEEEWRQSAM